MYGLTFNSKHSFNDFGLIMYSKNRPILSEPKIIVDEASGQDGEYDFSEVNPDKRTKYKPKVHEIEFTIKERDPALLRQKAHQIANWLSCGEQQLIYDDEPAVFYFARVVNKIDLENQIISIKRFTVNFKCRPFAYSIAENTATKTIAGASSLSISNDGTYVKPLIRVNGLCDNISFTLNGKTLTYNAPVMNEQLEIDCSKMEALKGSLNVTSKTTGDFLELANGQNTLQINGSNLNCTVSVIFRYQYF